MTVEKHLRGTFLHKPYVKFRTSWLFRIDPKRPFYLNLNPLVVQATKDRWNDYKNAKTNPGLKSLRKKLMGHLRRQRKNWHLYQYGFGYFYQGWDRVGITGARATEIRFNQYKLDSILKPYMQVLDIGANACMLTCAIAEKVAHVDALEFNPYQLAVGKDIAEYLNIKNISFIQADFQNYETNKTYDVILSCANHQTVDGNMAPDLLEYFEKLHNMLNENGILLFETHCFDNENPEFHRFMDSLSSLYKQMRKAPFSEQEIGGGGPRIFYVLEKIDL